MSKGENMVERCADIIASHVDMFYVSGAPPARAVSAALAVMDELWATIDLALMDFDARDPDAWARGHEHAKSVVRDYLRTALSQPNDEGEGK